MKEQQGKYNLPEEWKYVKLNDIAYINMGQSPPSTTYNYDKIGLPFFQGKAEFGKLYPIAVKYCSQPIKVAKKNDVLISIRAPIGSTNIATEDCCIGRGLASINTFGKVPHLYVLWYLRLIENKIAELGTGSVFKAISKDTLENINIPISSVSETEKIVFKIEELFSKLDEAENGLNITNRSLKIYRQALLKDAFAGKLTNQNIKGCKLPSGWKIIKISTISNVVRGGSPRPAGDLRYYEGNIPFLKVKDLTKDEKVHLTTFEYTIKEAGLVKTRRIKPGTLLLTNSGATLGIPKICLIDSTINDGVAAFLDLDDRSIYYLYYFLLLNTQKLRDISMGATQPNLNTTIIKNIELPYCSFEEQKQVVEIIESRFTLVDNLEKTVDNVLNEIIALKHSILKKAFEGRLISYTSNESVEKLLDDIQEEKRLYLENQKELNRSKPKQKKKMEEKKSILDILKESNSPISAQELWEKSKSEGDIEQFYSEIKEIYHQIDELKNKTESLLSLKDENK